MPDKTGAIDLSGLPGRMEAARGQRSAGPRSQGAPGKSTARVHSTVSNPDGSGVANIVVTDDAPPWMTPELEQTHKDLLGLTEDVKRRSQEVLRYGGHIPMESMFSLQLFTLVDMLFPRTTERGQRQFLEYQTRVQRRLLEILDSVEDQIHQAALAAGSNVPPEALARMAERAGIPRPAAEQGRQREG
jgi:hypothetical protein